MPKHLGVYIKTSWILFLSTTIGQEKESILLRWLEPENGQPSKKWLADDKLRQQIRLIVETGHTMNRLQNFAVSRTAGIWRIKRSKIILNFLDGLGIEKLVTKVRVPPESIVKCLNRFAQKGLKCFDHPERKPTKREMLVEQMPALLEAFPDPGSKERRQIKVRYIGHDFTAGHISKIGAQMRYLVFGGRDVQRTSHLLRKKRRQSRFNQWKVAFRQIKGFNSLLS
jgi:hypothetical protein